MSLYRKEKLASIFQSKDWSDCKFIINNEKIPAHKFLLAATSPVFESMFYGDLASNEILIEDIEVDVFKKTLEYIYTDEVKITCVQEAWGLIYVSQKYFLFELQRKSIEYIKNNLSISNLLLSYEYSRLYNQTQLVGKCLDDIVVFAKGVLLFSSYHMQPATLNSILLENKVNATDMILLAINWGVEECEINDEHGNKENVYSVLKKNGILNKLNFKDFKLECPMALKSLNKAQIYLLQNILDIAHAIYSEVTSYSTTSVYNKRSDFTQNNAFQYRTEFKNNIRMSVTHSEIVSPTIKCNKDCLLFGMVVSTKSHSSHSNILDYIGGANIYIYLKHKSNISHIIFEYENQHQFLKYDDTQKIIFPVPVLLEAYQEYLVCIEYISEPHRNESVLLTYLSDNLGTCKSDSAVIQFSSEGDGSVLKALCFYVV